MEKNALRRWRGSMMRPDSADEVTDVVMPRMGGPTPGGAVGG